MATKSKKSPTSHKSPAKDNSKKSPKPSAKKTLPDKKASPKKPKPTRAATGDLEKQMRSLENQIRHHQRLYYVEHKQSISDREFDRLLEQLKSLEDDNPTLVSADSPTKIVGSDLDNTFEKFTHTIPVLSLGNTYSTEDALAWAKKTSATSNYLVQWKVDGATLVLYYEKGVLKRAVTRGSGQIGDIVTANALTIRSIPETLTEKVDVVVRGEAYMNFSDFESFNEEFGSIFANPRNLTAGSLKHKKSSVTATRPIRWVAFDAYFAKDVSQTDSQTLGRLHSLGLPVSPDNRVVSLENLEKTIEDFRKRHKESTFPVDGLVIKIDDRSLRDDLGYTSSSPRWAVALKFEPDLATTRVEDIELFTGRTGRVTPRARLTPVKLAGTTVTFATLHNSDYINTLGVKIGSTVRISKRGEIIPAVEEVVEAGDGPSFQFPTTCPDCQTTLIKEVDAADWLCPNIECPSRILSTLEFFCQRKQMDIAGMGEKSIHTLYTHGFIESITDIYRLPERRSELEQLDGWGKKSVDVLVDGIEKSKTKPFRKVLPSLGLKELGHSVTDILLAHDFTNMDQIIEAAKSENAINTFSEIHGIGPRTAESIVKQLKDKRVLRIIKELKSFGLQFEENQKRVLVGDTFVGQVWCVTGSFDRFKPRDLAMEEVKKRGGKTTSSVSSKTTHLLAGREAGSKLDQAKKLGVAVVDEAEFLKLIS